PSFVGYSDLRDAVRGKLRYYAIDAPPDDLLVYYVVLVDADLGGDRRTPDLWAFARTVIGQELPTLRVVRLSGGSLEAEAPLATHIEAMMRRNLGAPP